MSELSAFYNENSIKMLLMGYSGSGKTGALASLALAGYKLRILDFDRGLESLVHQLSPKPGDTPERLEQKKRAISNVLYSTRTDSLQTMGKYIIPRGMPTAFSKAMDDITKFPGDPLGGIYQWGPDTVFVLDSLTFCGEAIMRLVLSVNGRSAAPRQQSDWGDAMQTQESLLALLYDNAVRCHVIVLSHITTAAEEGSPLQKGFPSALGSKLPPKVGRYFNSVLMAEKQPTKRVIRTQTAMNIELKNPAPDVVPAELPIETGLADFFKLISNKEKTK